MFSDRRYALDFLSNIPPSRIENYLTDEYWTRNGNVRDPLISFRKEILGVEKEVIFSRDQGLSDYKRLIEKLIRSLSEYEKKSFDDIYYDLILPKSDVLKFRLVNQDFENGTIPFKDVISFVESTKKALMATASAVVEPKKYFPRIALKEAESFIKACRFGQTEIGSFVANVICPLNVEKGDSDEEQNEMFSDLRKEEFGRKVTKTFMKTIDHLTTSIEQENIEKILDPPIRELIVSSNFCESLFEMNQMDGTSISVSLRGAPSGPSLGETPPMVVINSEYFPRFYEISKQLRREVEKPVRNVFVGQVSGLRRDAAEDLLDGQVIFEFKHEQEIIEARIELDQKLYDLACDLHKSKGWVSVEGMLIKKGKYYYIEQGTKFKKIEIK